MSTESLNTGQDSLDDDIEKGKEDDVESYDSLDDDSIKGKTILPYFINCSYFMHLFILTYFFNTKAKIVMLLKVQRIHLMVIVVVMVMIVATTVMMMKMMMTKRSLTLIKKIDIDSGFMITSLNRLFLNK